LKLFIILSPSVADFGSCPWLGFAAICASNSLIFVIYGGLDGFI